MKRFENILVGIDLSHGDRLVNDELTSPNSEAVERALWLARMNSSQLLFYCVLDISAKTLHLIESDGGLEPTVVDQAQGRLKQLVAQAADKGVAATGRVVIGKSWVEIIRQVLRGNHDLVIVGTRHFGAVRGFLVGSTGIKLFRKCPCPVWVTQPQPGQQITSILVAHDLRSVGDLAMELGCSMAALHDAQLHVLHAAEYPEYDDLRPSHVSASRVSAEEAARYRQDSEEHIAAQLSNFDLAQPAQVHFVTEPPEVAILDHLERYGVELLVMGTVARVGIPGLITGNTAERLLPQIPCSVLAVKPTGFKSPITLDDEVA